MRKVIICVFAIALVAVISFTALSESDVDVAGVIANIEIEKYEIDLARKDYEAYNPSSTNINSEDNSTMQVNNMTDIDFLKGIAKRRVTENLFEEYNIELSQEEIVQIHAYFDESMDIIYEQANSTDEQEKQGGLMLLQCMENAAQVRNMTLEQYKNEVCKKEYEYMRKKSKLVTAGFSSAQELDEYINSKVEKGLKVKNID